MEIYHSRSCPAAVVQIARSRWTFPLLVELAKGTTSFGRLKKALYPVTSKTLSSCIRNAAGENLIAKNGARYALIERGRQVLDAVRILSSGNPACKGCPGALVCQAHSL
jgi:DNA-binding HxlR family transcriptional regulator